MSGIYIPGMGMPKRGHTVTVTIGGCEEVYVEYYDCRPHVEEDIKYKAVPVTDHGRLIDAFDTVKKLCDSEYYNAAEIVSDMPTIIPADKEEEG